MTIKSKLLLVLALASLTGIMAQDAANSDSNLKVGLGLGYRHFSRTDFKGDASGTTTLYSGRQLGAMVESASQTTSGKWKSNSLDYEDCLAPVFFGGFTFLRKDALSLSAIVDFQYYSFDTSAKMDTLTVTTTYYTPVNHPEFGSVVGAEDSATSSLKAKAELDLYVLDLGLRADYAATDKLSLYAAVGPSVNFTDFNTKVAGESRSSNDCIFGGFAQAGLEIGLANHVAIAADIRYDITLDDAETRFAKQELDGFGASIKLVFSF